MRVCGDCAGLNLFSQVKGRCNEKEILKRRISYKGIVRHIEDSAEDCPRFKKARRVDFSQMRCN